MSTYEDRLEAIDWENYSTAYGVAVKVPDQLRRLVSTDAKEALDATHELWCGLCHQHVQIGSAALPALPFIMQVLDTASERMTIELLDILLGFAIGVNRQKAIDYQSSLVRNDIVPEEQWVSDLRIALNTHLPRFKALASSSNEDVAGYASDIVAELEFPQGWKKDK
jgi:hypothetical protein